MSICSKKNHIFISQDQTKASWQLDKANSGGNNLNIQLTDIRKKSINSSEQKKKLNFCKTQLSNFKENREVQFMIGFLKQNYSNLRKRKINK